MPCSNLKRRIVWLVLAMYLAAGAAAQLSHDCHGPAGGGSAAEGRAAEARGSHDTCCVAMAAAHAAQGASTNRLAVSRTAASDGGDACAACRFLGQLSHGLVLPTVQHSAALDAPLASPAPACALGGFLLVPHSRGPPQLV